MASFIEFLQGNPLYIVGFVCLIIFFIVSLLKKAIKLLVIALILFVGYSYYLNDIFDAYQGSLGSLELLESKAETLIKETLEQ
ncbi:hypothetical protein [Colwellia sp. 12G3]|uniref:hypothetical protein n=1 Tax=Colwellia sp. 12G3 TaxID=2058299 RepID=UPI000C33BCC1|nr:hypothetical protein [Colwellia sp. 12G3]PKI16228.1 hypothetical protein CXF71_11355 [Colwellia sp. 12G3]